MNRKMSMLALAGAILAGSLWLVSGVVEADAAPRTCTHGDRVYYHGAVSCQGGVAHQCDDGAWRDLGRAC